MVATIWLAALFVLLAATCDGQHATSPTAAIKTPHRSATMIQGHEPAQRDDNYIVSNSYDTILTDFAITNLATVRTDNTVWFPEKIVVIQDTSLAEFRPEDLVAFCYEGIPFETLNIDDGSSSHTKKFCRRLVDGFVSAFLCVDHVDGVSSPNVYLKHNDRVLTAANFKFPQTYHKTVPALQIQNLTRDELLATVQAFNRLLAPKISH